MSDDRSHTPLEVCLIMRHFHPILAGAAERFRRYSGPLADFGIHFRVFTLQESLEHPVEERMSESLVVHRIEARGTPWERDASLFQAAESFLRTVPAGRRVLQTSLCHKLSRPWQIRIGRLGVKSIYVGTMVGQPAEGPIWRRLIQAIRNRLNYAPFNRVVASTTVMKRWQAGLGIRQDRIEIIPNGVDITRFRPVEPSEKRRLREKLGLPLEQPVVLFAGSIVPRKGVELLLHAWKGVVSERSVHLALAGGFERPTFMTPERMKELGLFQDRMRAMAASPEMKGSVSFVGETQRIEDWMMASDLFVFPSEQEGMGNVVLEAMACGLPTVVTRFKGMPEEEFGTPNVSFSLVERTEWELTRKLLELLSDRQAASEMGLDARRWAEGEADVRFTIERYAKLYRELAGGS